VLGGVDVVRSFTNDVISTSKLWLALGSSSKGTVVIDSCAVNLSGASSTLKLVPTSTATATIRDCTFSGTTTAIPVNAEGGLVRFVNTPVPGTSRAISPGRFEIV
jgi:hypothetical protein